METHDSTANPPSAQGEPNSTLPSSSTSPKVGWLSRPSTATSVLGSRSRPWRGPVVLAPDRGHIRQLQTQRLDDATRGPDVPDTRRRGAGQGRKPQCGSCHGIVGGRGGACVWSGGSRVATSCQGRSVRGDCWAWFWAPRSRQEPLWQRSHSPPDSTNATPGTRQSRWPPRCSSTAFRGRPWAPSPGWLSESAKAMDARLSRGLLAGVMGGLAGAFLYEIIGELALPGSKLIEPVAATWQARLLAQALAVMSVAVGLAALCGRPAARKV